MTEQEQKELSEWAAEWLGGDVKAMRTRLTIGHFVDDASMLFNHPYASPILAHLAKRKMEEMGFHIISNSMVGLKPLGKYQHKTYKTLWGYFLYLRGLEVSKAEHENECIALWLAIRSAIGEKNKSDK